MCSVESAVKINSYPKVLRRFLNAKQPSWVQKGWSGVTLLRGNELVFIPFGQGRVAEDFSFFHQKKVSLKKKKGKFVLKFVG